MSAEAIQQQLLEQQQVIMQLQQQIQTLQQQQSYQQELTKQTVEASVNSMANKVSNASLSRAALAKIAKPSTFHGNLKSNIELWLFEMKSYLENCNVPIDQRVLFVGSYLKDNAALWFKYEVEKAAAEGMHLTWEALELKLLQRFRPIESGKTARVALASLKQQGSVQHYCNIFQQYVTLTTDMAEMDKIFAFQRGLKPYIAREVDMKEPQTLAEAMNYAIRADARNNLLFKNRSFRPFQHSTQWNSQSAPMEVDNLEMVDEQQNINESKEAIIPLNAMYGEPKGRTSSGDRKRVDINAADRERCIKERRCFNCKQMGHNNRGCQNPFSKNFPA